ncbi:MAG: TonB family protein [Ferruginibacter sp.]
MPGELQAGIRRLAIDNPDKIGRPCYRQFYFENNTSQHKIELAEDEQAINEKTLVTGKPASNLPARKSRSILMPDTMGTAEPADGWDNYDTYLINNLFMPDNIRQQNIHGEVGISFEVQNNGAVTNLKIDRSLCDDCDDAALRAVKEGPRWKVKKGAQAKGKVTVKF